MKKEELQKKVIDLQKELDELKEHVEFEKRFFTALLSIKVEASEKLAEAVECDDGAEQTKNEAIMGLIDKLVYFDEESSEGDSYNIDTINYYCWLAQKPKPIKQI